MVTSRFSKLFFSLFWLLISIAHCHAQIVPEELHDIDAFIADDGFQREQGEKVARLLVGFGKTELDNLKRLKNERPLDDIEAFRLEGLSNILAPIVSQRPDLKATLTFIHNPEIAKSVYRLVGQDRISELVASKIQSVVRSRVMHALKHSFSPVTVLDDDELRKALGLSEEQVVQLDKIHEETSERIRLGDPDAYQQIEHLLQSHWEQLLAVLDSKQSKIARNSIGSPIPWFKARKKLSFFGDSVSSHGFITVNGGIDNQAPDGRYLHNLSADELKQIGVDFLYMHCRNMLKSQFVLEEMEITPDQRKEIEKGIRKTTTIPSVQKGRIIELLGDEPTFPSFLEKELQDHQMQLLRNVELQSLTSQYHLSIGLRHPKVIDALGLSSKQLVEIAKLERAFERESGELIEQIRIGRENAQSDFTEQVRDLLSAEQQNQMKDWLSGKLSSY